jgi:hypothetical protein
MRRKERITIYVLDCRLNVFHGKLKRATWENRANCVFIKIRGETKKVSKEGWTKGSAYAAFQTKKELEEYKEMFLIFCDFDEGPERIDFRSFGPVMVCQPFLFDSLLIFVKIS